MTYKLKGRLNHKQMRELVGKNLYATMGDNVIPCLITGIEIGEDNKWKFTFINEKFFDYNETLYLTQGLAVRHINNLKRKQKRL